MDVGHGKYVSSTPTSPYSDAVRGRVSDFVKTRTQNTNKWNGDLFHRLDVQIGLNNRDLQLSVSMQEGKKCYADVKGILSI